MISWLVNFSFFNAHNYQRLKKFSFFRKSHVRLQKGTISLSFIHTHTHILHTPSLSQTYYTHTNTHTLSHTHKHITHIISLSHTHKHTHSLSLSHTNILHTISLSHTHTLSLKHITHTHTSRLTLHMIKAYNPLPFPPPLEL